MGAQVTSVTEAREQVLLVLVTAPRNDVRERVQAAIESYGNWAKAGPHDRCNKDVASSRVAWLVFTKATPKMVRDHLWQLMHPGDSVLVVTCHAPAAWAGYSDTVTEWIEARLRGPRLEADA